MQINKNKKEITPSSVVYIPHNIKIISYKPRHFMYLFETKDYNCEISNYGLNSFPGFHWCNEQ